MWSVHNNWLVGNSDKRGRAERWGHWRYNHTSDTCLPRQKDAERREVELLIMSDTIDAKMVR